MSTRNSSRASLSTLVAMSTYPRTSLERHTPAETMAERGGGARFVHLLFRAAPEGVGAVCARFRQG